jgi:hypothetical protein
MLFSLPSFWKNHPWRSRRFNVQEPRLKFILRVRVVATVVRGTATKYIRSDGETGKICVRLKR